MPGRGCVNTALRKTYIGAKNMDYKSVRCMVIATLAGILWGLSEIIILMALSRQGNPQILIILTFRAAFQVLVILPITVITHRTLLPASDEYIYVILRSLSEAVGCICVYLSLQYISPLQETLISSIKPFMVLLAGYFWLKEKIRKLDIVAILLVTVGVFLVSKPTYWMHHDLFTGPVSTNLIGVGLVLLSTISATVYICSCRRLAKTPVLIIICWISVFSLCGSGFLSAFFSNWKDEELMLDIGWSALIAVMILVAEALLTTALISNEAVNISICLNSQIPTTLVAQWVILDIVPSIDIWIGITIICFCIILNYFHDKVLVFAHILSRYYFYSDNSSEENIEVLHY